MTPAEKREKREEIHEFQRNTERLMQKRGYSPAQARAQARIIVDQVIAHITKRK